MNLKKHYLSTYYRSFALTSLFVIVILIQMKAQSPWTPGHLKGYSHITFNTLPTYTQVFEGNLSNLASINGRISERSLQSYTELGFGDNLGLILSIPIRQISASFDPGTPASNSSDLLGLGNVELGLKYKILEGPQTLAIGLNSSLNTSAGGTDRNIGLRTGYDAIGFTPFVTVGKGFDRSYLYANIGYEANSNDFSNFIKFGLEYGHKFWDKLWVIGAFNMREIAAKSEKAFSPERLQTRLYINDQFYNSLSLKLIYENSDQSGFNFSANLISVRANNLPFRSPLSLGYYRKW